MAYPMRWEETFTAPVSEETPELEGEYLRPGIRIWALVVSAVIGVALLAMAAFAVIALLERAQQPPVLRLELSPEGALVALTSSTATRRVGFVVVSGDIINHTSEPLKNVEAVVELRDGLQHTIKTESGLIELDPLPSGRTSPFQVELMDDPRAVGYRVHFKQLMGAPID